MKFCRDRWEMFLIVSSLSQMFLVQETTGEILFRATNWIAFEKGNDNSSILVHSAAAYYQWTLESLLPGGGLWKPFYRKIILLINHFVFFFFSPAAASWLFFTKEHALYFCFFGTQLLSFLCQSHNPVWDCAPTMEIRYMIVQISKHRDCWHSADKLHYQKEKFRRRFINIINFTFSLRC